MNLIDNNYKFNHKIHLYMSYVIFWSQLIRFIGHNYQINYSQIFLRPTHATPSLSTPPQSPPHYCPSTKLPLPPPTQLSICPPSLPHQNHTPINTNVLQNPSQDSNKHKKGEKLTSSTLPSMPMYYKIHHKTPTQKEKKKRLRN